MPLKREFALKIFTVLNILFTFRVFEQLALALKNRVCPEFTVLNIYFLSFRIFEQLALALKFLTLLKYFLSFRNFEQLALALKTEFALNFSDRGVVAPPPAPPPRMPLVRVKVDCCEVTG